MKQFFNSSGGGGGGGGGEGGFGRGGSGGVGGRLRFPSEIEVEVMKIILNLPLLIAKSELLTNTWGKKKKRSVLGSKSASSPAPTTTPAAEQRVVDSTPEKSPVTAADEADKSPTTPLNFLSSGSGSDGGDKSKPSKLSKPSKPPALKKVLKRKATEELMQSYKRMQQEREIILRETKAMKSLHQKLTSINMELKAIKQKVSYTRNIEDFKLWNNSLKPNDQQSYQPQITIYAPPTPQQQHYQQSQQLVVDHHNNRKLVAVSCSGNSHGGGRFNLFNQIDPRVKIQGEAYHDFLACSQPLDQSGYLMMDSDLQLKTAAAAARKRRMMRRKENRSALLALRLSRGCSR